MITTRLPASYFYFFQSFTTYFTSQFVLVGSPTMYATFSMFKMKLSFFKETMGWYDMYLPILFSILDVQGSGTTVVIPRNEKQSQRIVRIFS